MTLLLDANSPPFRPCPKLSKKAGQPASIHLNPKRGPARLNPPHFRRLEPVVGFGLTVRFRTAL